MIPLNLSASTETLHPACFFWLLYNFVLSKMFLGVSHSVDLEGLIPRSSNMEALGSWPANLQHLYLAIWEWDLINDL